MEDCQSGRMCLSRKQVGCKASQVQILYLPPSKVRFLLDFTDNFALFCFCLIFNQISAKMAKNAAFG